MPFHVVTVGIQQHGISRLLISVPVRFEPYLLALAILNLTSCSRGFPPFVVNVYKAPIKIAVTFSNNWSPKPFVLLPNNFFAANKKGLKITSITLEDPHGTQIVYGETDFENARLKHVVKTDVWMLSDAGLTLGDEKDLRRIERENAHQLIRGY